MRTDAFGYLFLRAERAFRSANNSLSSWSKGHVSDVGVSAAHKDCCIPDFRQTVINT